MQKNWFTVFNVKVTARGYYNQLLLFFSIHTFWHLIFHCVLISGHFHHKYGCDRQLLPVCVLDLTSIFTLCSMWQICTTRWDDRPHGSGACLQSASTQHAGCRMSGRGLCMAPTTETCIFIVPGNCSTCFLSGILLYTIWACNIVAVLTLSILCCKAMYFFLCQPLLCNMSVSISELV